MTTADRADGDPSPGAEPAGARGGARAGGRMSRSRVRTRGALIAAARRLLATRDAASITIQDLTDTADVGFGSFYNHFTDKAELFDAAVAETLEEHGALLDSLTADVEDPAEVYALSVRLTCRLRLTHPELAGIVVRTGQRLVRSDAGLAPRARRDLERAVAAGRFEIDDVEIALTITGGALLAVLDLTLEMPDEAVGPLADTFVAQLLRMFGLSRSEALRLVARPLPAGTPGPLPGAAAS